MESPRVDEEKCERIQSARELDHKSERGKVKPILKFHENCYTTLVWVCKYLRFWLNAMYLKIRNLYGKIEILVVH
jgi:hypothetical protein